MKRRRNSQILTISSLLFGTFLAVSWTLPRLGLRDGRLPYSVHIPAFPDPGEDAFFISTGSEELSHIALYHDIGASIDHARKADILLFGNSRLQTGLREEIIATEAQKLGLRAFTIAVGHADKTRFALELIRKHDLRPKVVIASGGPFVFTEGLSPWAREVMAMDRWDARKLMWERTAAWAVRARLHRYLPHLDFFEDTRYGWIHYRSERTGWWRNVVEPPGRLPVTRQPERRHYRHTLPLAEELKQELDNRGTLLLLTMVPYLNTRSGHLAYLSSELQTPYILPSFDELYTADGSHLDRDSAIRISREFWTSFIALEEVRNRLELK
jgi:hypothetical protein